MADITQLLAQARNPQEVALLLSAMGQTGSMASPTAVQTDPMNLSSAREAELLLSSLGQTNRGQMAPVATDPLFRASGEFFQTDIGNINSESAARALLNSMGQTGAMAEKVPMSPSTSAGFAGTSGGEGGDYKTPLSAEDRMFIDASYAGLQADVDRLLENPEARKKILGDDGMRDIPRTGKADTRGGVNRVNQYTSEHGVTATRDPETGQVMLTNIGADGKPTPQSQKQVYGFNPMNATGSAALDSIYEQIKNAKNSDEARGIAAAARTSLAEEGARIESQALTFAANKVGIPALRERLKASETIDMSQPGYMPGIGDSKNTAAIRNEVAQAEAQARQIAEDWKKSNLSAARLASTASNIEAELKRIDLIERKKEGLEATTQAQQERKQIERDAIAQERYDSFSAEQKMIMSRLNPELAAKPDNQGEMVAYFQRQMTSDPAFRELIQSDPADIIKLAARGNKLARALTVQEEAVATGRPPDVIDQEIRSMQQLANDPNAINAWAMASTASIIGDKVAARKAAIGRYNALASGTTKEEKAQYESLRGEIALTAFKANKTAKFVSDVSTWNSTDPEVQAATEVALTTSGKTDLDSVLTAYVGATTGPEALAKYAAFKESVRQAAQQQSKSVFGGVDSASILSRIDTAAKEKGQLAEWYKQRWGWTEDISRTVVTNIADLLGN